MVVSFHYNKQSKPHDFPSTFEISCSYRPRKSKNDKKEKNVTNELVFAGILYVQVD